MEAGRGAGELESTAVKDHGIAAGASVVRQHENAVVDSRDTLVGIVAGQLQSAWTALHQCAIARHNARNRQLVGAVADVDVQGSSIGSDRHVAIDADGAADVTE